MFRKPLFYVFLALILTLAACSPQSVQLTADDNGGQVEVKSGQEFTITLTGNPSTGYMWEIQDLDTTLFEQVGDAQFVSDNPGLVGSGGSITLTFKALQTGTGVLTLVNHRSWEDTEPIDTFTVTVIVK